jgi:hypothetical protein
MSDANGDGDGNGVGRDAAGRVLPGSRLAAGNRGANPTARRMNELRRALTEAATDDDIRDLYRSLLASAKGGDTQAARVLLEYLCGKPVATVEVSGPDGSSLDLPAIVATILSALGDDQAAVVRVAAAFHKLSLGVGGPSGDP